MDISSLQLSQPVMLLVIAGVLALNIMLLALFAFAVVSFLKKIAWTQQESEKVKQQALHETTMMRDHARHEAETIIAQAHEKATEAIKKMDVLGAGIQQDIEKALEQVYKQEVERVGKTADHLITEYRSLFDQIQKKHIEASQSSVQHIAEGFETTVASFQKFLEGEMGSYRKEIQESVEESQRNVRKEIEEYKSQAFKKVEDAMYRVIQFVAQRVLGEAITIEQHRKLIVTALEEAKREGFFGL